MDGIPSFAAAGAAVPAAIMPMYDHTGALQGYVQYPAGLMQPYGSYAGHELGALSGGYYGSQQAPPVSRPSIPDDPMAEAREQQEIERRIKLRREYTQELQALRAKLPPSLKGKFGDEDIFRIVDGMLSAESDTSAVIAELRRVQTQTEMELFREREQLVQAQREKRENGCGDARDAEGADGDRLEEALAAQLAEKDEQIVRQMDLVLYQTQSELHANGFTFFRVTNDPAEIGLQQAVLACMARALGVM